MEGYNAKEVFNQKIAQLEGLREHCLEMAKANSDEENVWKDNVHALEFAIATLKISSYNLK